MNASLVISIVGAAGVGLLLLVVVRRRRHARRSSRPDGPTTGARLTSERLVRLPTPPWRFVIEIADARLAGIDQIVIGPCGVIAIESSLTSRPSLDRPADDDPHGARAVAAAAITRSAVDELLAPSGLTCEIVALVHWGPADPNRPPAEVVCHATVAVDGRRLEEWLASVVDGMYARQALEQPAIDLAWQTIAIGIGRPDPLIA